MELFTFKASDQYLGIEAQYIHQIVEEIAITPVPLTPCCHMGLIYYRRELFDVIDIGSLLKKKNAASPLVSSELSKRRTNQENSRIILLKWNQKKLGLVPDKIIGLIWVDNNKSDSEHTVFAEQGYTVQIIAPDEIRELLLKLNYGFRKV